MPFPVPQIDHRSHRQLVTEALDRVPGSQPGVDQSPGRDPGVTLVQLFAFLTESLNYRANLIPERNRAKFLRLLGVGLQPAAAARGLVTFSNPRGPLAPLTLDADREVFAGRVPFRTTNALTLLPVEGSSTTRPGSTRSASRRSTSSTAGSTSDRLEGVEPEYYETRAFPTPPAASPCPASTWLRTPSTAPSGSPCWPVATERPEDARAVIADEILTLGVLPAVDETAAVLPPGGAPAPGRGRAGLVFQVPRAETGGVRWERLEARPSSDLVTAPGTVELRLPAASHLVWEESETFDPLEAGVGELPRRSPTPTTANG